MSNQTQPLPRTAATHLTQEQLTGISILAQSLFQNQPDPEAAVEQLIDRLADADLMPEDWYEPSLPTVGQWLTENPLTLERLSLQSVRNSLTNSETPPQTVLESFLDALTAKM